MSPSSVQNMLLWLLVEEFSCSNLGLEDEVSALCWGSR